MNQGGVYIPIGHIPIVCVILLRRHIRKIANVPKSNKQQKIIILLVLLALLALFFIDIFLFKLLLVSVLLIRFINDMKICLIDKH